jgi:replicative DNA helicase
MKHEKALLGAVIREKKIPEDFTLDLFGSEQCKKIAESMMMGDTDFLSLSEKHDTLVLAECVNIANDLMNAEKGVEILRKKRLKRKVLELTERARQDIEDKTPQEVAAALALEALNLVDERPREKTDVATVLQEIEQDQEQYLEATLTGRTTIGIPTGYKLIDQNISGLRPNHLIVLSAYTNVGKTTFALNIARNVLEQGKRVVVLSLEMSKKDLLSKLIAIQGNIPMSNIISAGANNKHWELFKQAREEVKKFDMDIHTEKHDLQDILLTMKAEESRRHVDLFIIDYLQNIVGEGKEYEVMTRAVREIQALLAKLGSTCIAISQISNDNRKADALSVNGKGSGAIRAAADLFIYLTYRDEDDDEILKKLKADEPMPMLAIINKNRHGKLAAGEFTRNPYSGEMYESD